MRTCIPGPLLRPFVKLLWASEEAAGARLGPLNVQLNSVPWGIRTYW
jgi:hypothetical protein